MTDRSFCLQEINSAGGINIGAPDKESDFGEVETSFFKTSVATMESEEAWTRSDQMDDQATGDFAKGFVASDSDESGMEVTSKGLFVPRVVGIEYIVPKTEREALKYPDAEQLINRRVLVRLREITLRFRTIHPRQHEWVASEIISDMGYGQIVTVSADGFPRKAVMHHYQELKFPDVRREFPFQYHIWPYHCTAYFDGVVAMPDIPEMAITLEQYLYRVHKLNPCRPLRYCIENI